jgi:uncharacterized ion transporter superfamily protein YfcC
MKKIILVFALDCFALVCLTDYSQAADSARQAPGLFIPIVIVVITSSISFVVSDDRLDDMDKFSRASLSDEAYIARYEKKYATRNEITELIRMTIMMSIAIGVVLYVCWGADIYSWQSLVIFCLFLGHGLGIRFFYRKIAEASKLIMTEYENCMWNKKRREQQRIEDIMLDD